MAGRRGKGREAALGQRRAGQAETAVRRGRPLTSRRRHAHPAAFGRSPQARDAAGTWAPQGTRGGASWGHRRAAPPSRSLRGSRARPVPVCRLRQAGNWMLTFDGRRRGGGLPAPHAERGPRLLCAQPPCWVRVRPLTPGFPSLQAARSDLLGRGRGLCAPPEKVVVSG